MRRTVAVTACLLTLALVAHDRVCQADGWGHAHPFWNRAQLDYHRNQLWPEPFQTQDRALYRSPWFVMMDNGWRLQNTLADELFDAETHQLTYAGRRRLAHILTHAPLSRRTVFVLRAADPQVTAERVAAVERDLQRMLPEGDSPPVLLTDVGPRQGTGDYFDRVNRALEHNIPAPRLPSCNLGNSE